MTNLTRVKLKAVADNKIDVTEKLKFALEQVENVVGKGENACYQYFLLFTHFFQTAYFSGLLKVRIVWNNEKLCTIINPLPDTPILGSSNQP